MKKKFLATMVILVTLFAITIPAVAAQRQVMATYSGSRIMLNGADLKAEPVEINGTTYLPLRTVAEALDLEVEWNGVINTINLTSSGYISPTTNSNNSIGYNRNNPAPVGTSQTINVESFVYGTYNATITLNDVIRGEKAWEKIKEANMFNSSAKDGFEYVLAYVKATVNTSSKDVAVSFSEYDFDVYNSSNSKYDSSFVIEPEPTFSGQAYAGGSVEGWIAFEVAVTDLSPKMVFAQKYDGTGGIWFSLK